MLMIKNDDDYLGSVSPLTLYIPEPNCKTYLNLYHCILKLNKEPWGDYEQIDYPMEGLNQIDEILKNFKEKGLLREAFIKSSIDPMRQPIVDEITCNLKSYWQKARNARSAEIVKPPTMRGRKKERALGFLIFALAYDFKKLGPERIREEIRCNRYVLIQRFLKGHGIYISANNVKKHSKWPEEPHIPPWIIFTLFLIGPSSVKKMIESGYESGLLTDVASPEIRPLPLFLT